MIQVGSEVYLRSFRHGQPGRVIRIERGRMVVLWGDLDYVARHPERSLIEAIKPHSDVAQTGQNPGPPEAVQ